MEAKSEGTSIELGLTVVRQTESGKIFEQIQDPRNLLNDLLPDEDGSFFCLRFIDWYGDTIFNRLQIKEQFIPEWKRLFRQTQRGTKNAPK